MSDLYTHTLADLIGVPHPVLLAELKKKGGGLKTPKGISLTEEEAATLRTALAKKSGPALRLPGNGFTLWLPGVPWLLTLVRSLPNRAFAQCRHPQGHLVVCRMPWSNHYVPGMTFPAVPLEGHDTATWDYTGPAPRRPGRW